MTQKNQKQMLWSNKELKILKTHYLILGRDIEKLLPNRTWHSIWHKANSLGLYKLSKIRRLNLTETEKAYIAGIIDGEGWITFTKGWSSKKEPTRYLSVKVGYANTSLELLEWMEQKLNGLNLFKERRPMLKSQKQCYYVTVSGIESVHALLEQITPYLVIKKERAKLMLSYTITRLGLRRGSPYTLDPQNVAEKIWILNQRGRMPKQTMGEK